MQYIYIHIYLCEMSDNIVFRDELAIDLHPLTEAGHMWRHEQPCSETTKLQGFG
jgi:hypothetical protein